MTTDDVSAALIAAAEQVGGRPRAGQLVMAEAITAAINTHEHLIVQAGTGTGKSLAYLVPAFLHADGDEAQPVVIATATLALQRQLIEHDIPRVIAGLAPLMRTEPSAAVLKGRHHYLCLLRLTEQPDPGAAAPELFTEPGGTGWLSSQFQQVRAWSEETTTGDRDDLPEPVDGRVWRSVSVTSRECVGRQRCPEGDECFAELARDRARAADVVVTNHAMLAIEWIDRKPVLPEHDAVIIDEAHEWVDRATSAATADLAPGAAEALVSAVSKQGDGRAGQNLALAAEALNESLTQISAMGGAQRWVQVPESVQSAIVGLRSALGGSLTAVVSGAKESAPVTDQAVSQRLRGSLEELIDVCDRILGAGSDDVLWWDQRPLRLRIAPLSIAQVMQRSVHETTVIATSATLSAPGGRHSEPFGHIAGAWGLPADSWTGLDIDSPFDYAKQGIVYVAAHLAAPGRDLIADEVLDHMAELIEASAGSALALFSSWRALERAAEYFRVRLGGAFPLLVQGRGDAVAGLVEQFRAQPGSVLAGTVSLWQGVDVPGDACRLVIIDRIPFAPPDDPVLAARMETADANGGSGFAQVALPRAAVLLAQGVGRLIRGPHDRGVVAVLDSRMLTKGYGRQLRAALPPLWLTDDPAVAQAALTRLRPESVKADEAP